MSRSFSSDSLIALPNLTAISTARLMRELLNVAATENALPAAIADDRDALAAAHEVLLIELGKRLEGEGAQKALVRSADRVEDNAFGALSDFLLAFSRLPEDRHPEAAEAQAVHDALFPQGLGFLAIRPADEWQEAETRLRLIQEKGLGTTIAKLGGTPFLVELAAAHKAYGEALGITAVKPEPEAPSVGGAREAALEALRSYVLRVAAHVKKGEPATAALAERLLEPLASYKSRPRKGRAQDASEPPAEGESAQG
ncbi:hypothetical protein [Polyangium aurulentum]|uniref:hypothetical protein n=1 Tax=Polyangium aurulentum TaxID=2567896 RepID=UPI0010ADEFA4|nr:hypothetical protein [Polyangium aurulentum]UQA58679.1 hypothetical protein E8A73_046845 [Polyangium aurulentum]